MSLKHLISQNTELSYPADGDNEPDIVLRVYGLSIRHLSQLASEHGEALAAFINKNTDDAVEPNWSGFLQQFPDFCNAVILRVLRDERDITPEDVDNLPAGYQLDILQAAWMMIAIDPKQIEHLLVKVVAALEKWGTKLGQSLSQLLRKN